MSSDKTPRILQQQQPPRENDPEQQKQQQSGSADFQSRPEGKQQMGEGSYEATRDYQKNIKGYLDKADVKSDAEAAKPRSEQEAREMEEAEREGKSHSRGER